MKPKLINKQAKKRREGKCYICDVDDYDVLDVHRITEGKDGGRYTEYNTVVLCSVCHRKTHAGTIKINRWYQGSKGRMLNYIENGEEKWK